MKRFVPGILTEGRDVRILGVATLVSSMGFGLYLPIIALYLRLQAGLSAIEIGMGFAVAGAVGLTLAVFVGHFADRLGPREVTIATDLACGALVAMVAFIDSLVGLIAIVVPLAIAQSGGAAAQGALLSGVLGQARRVRITAHLRSVYNVGLTLGAAVAGLALVFNNRPAYLWCLWGYTACRVAVALIRTRLPRVPGAGSEYGAILPTRALRDLPYVLVAHINGLGYLGVLLLELGIPLWIVGHTGVPPAMVALLVGLNTVIVVCFQVRATRGADSPGGAQRAQKRSFAAFATCCLLVAASSGRPVWVAIAALIGAVIVLTLGEMWVSAAAWSQKFGLAPDLAQGQYGAVFTLGVGVYMAMGPPLVTAATDQFRQWGWLGLATIFLGGILATGPAIRWATRTRPPDAGIQYAEHSKRPAGGLQQRRDGLVSNVSEASIN